MRCDIHALSGAYALDALDGDERIEFEKHLLGCSECREEVDSLAETATTLAMLTSTPAPGDLRERVLADAKRVRPLPPVALPPVVQRPTARRWRTGILTAAAAVLLVVGGLFWQPWNESAPPAVTTVAQVAAADDVQELHASLPDGARVTIYRSVDLDRVAVVGHGMPPLDGDQVYQLWLQDDDGTMQPAGIMPTGSRPALVLDGSATGMQAAGITVEPAGGSPAPTSEPLTVVGFDSA